MLRQMISRQCIARRSKLGCPGARKENAIESASVMPVPDGRIISLHPGPQQRPRGGDADRHTEMQ